MKISVVVKQTANHLLYFFLNKSKWVVQLAIISKKKRESNVPYFFSVVVNLLYKQLQEIVCRVTNCLAVCSTPNATLLQMQHCIGPHKKVANKHLEWATYIPHFPAKKWLNCCLFSLKMFVRWRHLGCSRACSQFQTLPALEWGKVY